MMSTLEFGKVLRSSVLPLAVAGFGLVSFDYKADAAGKYPVPTDLVNVAQYVPDIVVSKPYATPDNFTGQVVYPASNPELVGVCMMTRAAALKLKIADEYLKEHTDGHRLYAWDCYRPEYAQRMLRTAYGCDSNPSRCSGFIASAGYSNHQAGVAFDGTLADRNGNLLPMPTDYDDFTGKAGLGAQSMWSVEARANYAVYDAAMDVAGCTSINSEWWHKDCK